MALFGASGQPIGKPKPGAGPAAGGGGGMIVEGTDQSFKADVLDASMQQPVLVDFWAPWCGPCRTLGPMIERAVAAAGGRVKLVKINIDENPAYAGQLRVQSIPAVFAFDKGRPVDGFMGALPESQIKAFIDRLVGQQPGGVGELLEAAAESLELGDVGGAAQSFAEALGLEPDNVKAIAGLSRCYLMGGDLARAEEVLAMAPADKASDPDIAGVRAQLSLAAGAQDAGDPHALAKKLAAAPDDHQTRYDLAQALIAQGDLMGAVNLLLDIVERARDWNEDAARKQALKIFEAAGPAADVSKAGRRRLSSILFS
jgi:putative thioredoxin